MVLFNTQGTMRYLNALIFADQVFVIVMGLGWLVFLIFSEEYFRIGVLEEVLLNRIIRVTGPLFLGVFSEGLAMIPAMEAKLKEIELYLDSHRILVFYYKIACLYFGAGKPAKAIDYLNRIINWKLNLRDDLQCYARLLHLIAHYEMGNTEVVNYLSKSVYRFMYKMKSLSTVEEVMFNFLRKSIQNGGEENSLLNTCRVKST